MSLRGNGVAPGLPGHEGGTSATEDVHCCRPAIAQGCITVHIYIPVSIYFPVDAPTAGCPPECIDRQRAC